MKCRTSLARNQGTSQGLLPLDLSLSILMEPQMALDLSLANQTISWKFISFRVMQEAKTWLAVEPGKTTKKFLLSVPSLDPQVSHPSCEAFLCGEILILSFPPLSPTPHPFLIPPPQSELMFVTSLVVVVLFFQFLYIPFSIYPFFKNACMCHINWIILYMLLHNMLFLSCDLLLLLYCLIISD